MVVTMGVVVCAVVATKWLVRVCLMRVVFESQSIFLFVSSIICMCYFGIVQLRKFVKRALPFSVRMDSGWNWTPAKQGMVLWRSA